MKKGLGGEKATVAPWNRLTWAWGDLAALESILLIKRERTKTKQALELDSLS